MFVRSIAQYKEIAFKLHMMDNTEDKYGIEEP